MSASVKIEGISKTYKKGLPVLLPLDLEIKAGELFFLLGPSGCGKKSSPALISRSSGSRTGKPFL